MKEKNLLVILLMTLLVSTGVAQQKKVLSPRTANYDIQVRLDVPNKKLIASTQLLWNNPSADTIRELQFHVYLNAFKNTESTFMKGSGRIPDFFKENLLEKCGWSWVNIKSMKDEYGNDLTLSMNYIHPEDDNAADQTVLKVPLPQPVLPHQSIRVHYDWEVKIPLAVIRTGYNKDFYFFAQWFPKLGVYETAGTRFATKGQWNCHQYHRNGEYYSDFGVYHVEINVPKDFVVGASGECIHKEEKGDRRIWTFHLEDVIDFTWASSPHFEVTESEWNGVKLYFLSYPKHQHFARRQFATIKNALDFFSKNIGAYPYKTLTIVQPPIHGLFTGGMEYPTLITSMGLCFIPKGIHLTETLTIHEFTHQYFMQMVATNEQEEPWMDEGITTYYETRILDTYYGEKTSTANWMGIKIGSVEYNRAEFFAFNNIKIAPDTFKSRDYVHGGYSRIAYNKTAIWLSTLEGIIGRKTFDEAMKTYFQKWKFKHPCRNDFINVFNEVVHKNHGNKFGENLDWFFQQVLYGTDECDYKVAAISNHEVFPKAGFFENIDDCITRDEKNFGGIYRSKVILNRLGELKFPLDILVRFDNGDEVLENWDGMARSTEFVYKGKRKISSVEIDPKRKIWIDKNFINNSLTLQPERKGIRKYLSQFLFWLQNTMQTLSMFI